jgi:hypothetical protein
VRHDRRDDDPTLEYAAEELVAESVVFCPERSRGRRGAWPKRA